LLTDTGKKKKSPSSSTTTYLRYTLQVSIMLEVRTHNVNIDLFE
jgi:hypothetical protein